MEPMGCRCAWCYAPVKVAWTCVEVGIYPVRAILWRSSHLPLGTWRAGVVWGKDSLSGVLGVVWLGVGCVGGCGCDCCCV